MDIDTSAPAKSHPRRPPAHRSVSLRHVSPAITRARSHEPEVRLVNANANGNYISGQAQRPSSSPSSLKPLIGKDDSGESSNAERWFEQSNNHASGNETTYVENSPPFFLQNSSSEDTHLEAGGGARPHGARHGVTASAGSLPFPSNMFRFATDNSSAEDFRSVIDDLTIENKKLRRKLRTYEKTQHSLLKDQKLFEVRVHGLPVQKKRELEEVLRQFALALGPQQEDDAAISYYNAPVPQASSLIRHKSASTSASNPNTDSAYVSASNSGQGSSSIDSRRKQASRPSMTSRQQNVQSYLHDIPEGLMPRHASAMTEKARKKMVVRRLEHIFAGQLAIKGGNQQPQQQEEVSQQAASNDRRAFEEGGNKAPSEGHREALIMSEAASATNHQDRCDAAFQNKEDDGKRGDEEIAAPRAAHTLEQRPTRPLDLDPYRAQIPTENFDYIRHLGFSPPGADSMTSPTDDHGWIYLNLLANMAQLHTLNVTGEFVRKAVQDYSRKLELSPDGRKIRWMGGRSITKHSSDGDNTPRAGLGASNPQVQEQDSFTRKRLKAFVPASGSRNGGLAVKNADKFSYTPLFRHRSSNEESDLSSSSGAEDTSESAVQMHQTGDSSGMTSSGINTASTKRKRAMENGPIIFYNNAKFYTDLSGDPNTEQVMTYNAFLYHNVVQQAIGTSPSGTSSPGSSPRGEPVIKQNGLPETIDLDDNPVPPELEVKFPSPSMTASRSPLKYETMQFEVSGLGGVCPADNFTINVQSRHVPMDVSGVRQRVGPATFPRYSARIIQSLAGDYQAAGRNARPLFHDEVLDTRREELPPSRLPDASNFMPVGDTTPEEGEEEGDDVSDFVGADSISPDTYPPVAAPKPMDFAYSTDSSEAGDDEDDDDDSESEGSVDLLATARELDFEAIHAREREYDANMAERLAEEIPAGSSAATAGGGSGFASPVDGLDSTAVEAARRELRVNRGNETIGRESSKRKRVQSSAEGA